MADLEALTVLGYDPSTHVLTYLDEDGDTETITLGVGELSYEASTNTLTYVAEDGTPTTLPLNATNLAYDEGTHVLTYTNSLGVAQPIDLSAIVADLEALTVLEGTVVTNDDDETVYRLTYTDENSDDTEIDISANNGLHIDNASGAIKLGGELTEPKTEITTDEDHTLAITGLQAANLDELDEFDNNKTRIVTVDEDGVLKSVSANKFVRFFYMPSIVFDTSNPGTEDEKDLYDEYIKQFTGDGTSTPNPAPIRSNGAPEKIPYLPNPTDFYYYVTYYDTNVFENLNITADGKLSYRVKGPGTPTSFMNIVFVIKGEED